MFKIWDPLYPKIYKHTAFSLWLRPVSLTSFLGVTIDTRYAAGPYNVILQTAHQLDVKFQSHFQLTGELWVAFVSYVEKSDHEVSGAHCSSQALGQTYPSASDILVKPLKKTSHKPGKIRNLIKKTHNKAGILLHILQASILFPIPMDREDCANIMDIHPAEIESEQFYIVTAQSLL